MGTQNLIVTSNQYEDIRLKSITTVNLEALRKWKNENKTSYFYQLDISQEQQEKWFEGFCLRDNDFMFVVEEKNGSGYRDIGSVGFRIYDDCVDIYNIMRGEKSLNRNARIGDAVILMCSYINSISDKKITCKVLSNNPAVEWYKSIGFEIRDEHENYFNVDLNYKKFKFCQISSKGEF